MSINGKRYEPWMERAMVKAGVCHLSSNESDLLHAKECVRQAVLNCEVAGARAKARALMIVRNIRS